MKTLDLEPVQNKLPGELPHRAENLQPEIRP
jgi:hypothetical protein